jgi:hypothetical protein
VSTSGIGLYRRLCSLQIFTPQLSPIKVTNCRRDATSPDSDTSFANNNLRRIRDVLDLLTFKHADPIPISDSPKRNVYKIGALRRKILHVHYVTNWQSVQPEIEAGSDLI